MRYLNTLLIATIMILVSMNGVIDTSKSTSEIEYEILEEEPVIEYPSQATSPGHVVFGQYISSDNCGHCSKTGGGSDAHHSIKQNHPMEYVYITYMSASYGDTDTARAGNVGPYNWAWSTSGAPDAYFGDRTDKNQGGANNQYTTYDALYSSGGGMASTTNDYSMAAGISQNGGTYDISISYSYTGTASPASNMKLYAAIVDKDCTGYSYTSGIPHGYNCWMGWLTSGDTYKSKNGGTGTAFESVTLTSNFQTSTWSSVPTSVVPGGLSKAIVIGVLMSGNSVSVGGTSEHVYHAVDSTMNPLDLSVTDLTITNDDSNYEGFLAGESLTIKGTVKNTGTEDYSDGGTIQLYHVDGATENAIGQAASLNSLNVGQTQDVTAQFDTTGLTMNANGLESFRVRLSNTMGESDPVSNNRMDTWISHDYIPSTDTPIADGNTAIPRGGTLAFDVTGNSRDSVDTLATMTAEFQVSPSGQNIWESTWVTEPTSLTSPGTPYERYVMIVEPAATASSGDYDVRARLTDNRGQTSEWSPMLSAFSLMNGLPSVVDPNQPDNAPSTCPAFPGTPTVMVETDERVSLAGLVCDAETELTNLLITSQDPSFIAWHASAGEIEVNFAAMQWDNMGNPMPQGIGISIHDGEDVNTGTLLFNVIENGQPRWSSIPSQSFDEGGYVSLTLPQYLTDTDSNGDPASVMSLSLAIVSVEPSDILSAEIIGNGLMATAIDGDAFGSVVVTVRATDTDGNPSDQEVHIHVQNINDAPRFDMVGLENLMVQVDDTLEIDLSSRLTDIDDDDNEIWATVSSNGGMVQFNPISGMLTATYSTAGINTIQLSAEDANGGVDQWSLTVNVVDSVPLVWSTDGSNGDIDIVVSDMYFGKDPTIFVVQLNAAQLTDIVAEWQICISGDLGICHSFGTESIDASTFQTGHTFVAPSSSENGLANFDEFKIQVTAVGTDGFDYESEWISYLAIEEPGTEPTDGNEGTNNNDNNQQDGGSEDAASETGGVSGMVIAGVLSLVVLLVIAGVLAAMLLRGGREEEELTGMDWGAETVAPAAPAPAPPVATPAATSVPDYTQLTPGGQYVTGHAGETVYLSPDGTAWTMQADSSFVRTS